VSATFWHALMTVPRYCAAVCSKAATAARFLCSSVPASNSVCAMPPAMLHTPVPGANMLVKAGTPPCQARP
jgi:hypothetical protein